MSSTSLPDPLLRLDVLAAERTGARLHGDMLPAVRTTPRREGGAVLHAPGAREDAQKNHGDDDQDRDFHQGHSTKSDLTPTSLSETLAAANHIIAEQTTALAKAHAALRLAYDAMITAGVAA